MCRAMITKRNSRRRQVHDYPRDLGSQLDYELLRFVRDEPTPDLAAVSPLPVEDREILAAMLDGLNNFRDVARSDSKPMLSKKIQPLLDMADRLRSQAELTIPTMAAMQQRRSVWRLHADHNHEVWRGEGQFRRRL